MGKAMPRMPEPRPTGQSKARSKPWISPTQLVPIQKHIVPWIIFAAFMVFAFSLK